MRRWKQAVWVLSAVPVLMLVFQAFSGGLGANPIQVITRSLGDWSLRFLLLSLAITPLRMWTGWRQIVGLRRTFGLVAFSFACLHLLSYVGLDLFFDLDTLLKDLVKRTFITVGMVAFVLLVPLAITSSHKMIRRMNPQHWRLLHRMVYVISPLVILHFWMMIKAGYDRPTLYGLVALALLSMRLVGITMREPDRGTYLP